MADSLNRRALAQQGESRVVRVSVAGGVVHHYAPAPAAYGSAREDRSMLGQRSPWAALTVGLVLCTFIASDLIGTADAGTTAPPETHEPPRTRPNDAAITLTLLGAAEPFEALSETAFRASPLEIDRRIVMAERAAGNIQTIIPYQDGIELDRRMLSIRAAREKHQRTSLALAAIEAYRLIVSAIPGTPLVPVEVDLLDGFVAKLTLGIPHGNRAG